MLHLQKPHEGGQIFVHWGSGWFLMFVSLIIGLKGFWIFFKHQMYFHIVGHLIFLIGFPFLFLSYLNFILVLDADSLYKMILALPVVIFVPIWLVWGFFINRSAEKIDEQKKCHGTKFVKR